MILEYILTSLAVLLVGFIGWFGTAELLTKYKKFNKNSTFYFGILIFIVSWFVYGLILFFIKLFNPILILLPIFILIPFSIKFTKKLSPDTKIVVYIFLLQFFIGIFLQTLLAYYPLGSDWFRYYQASENFLAGEFATAYGRTPIFNILGAMFLDIFSNHFWVYQIASVFMNSLLIIPLYLVAREYNKKYAFLTILFTSLNSFMLQNTVYTWPRNFSMFFILFSYYFVMKNRISTSSLTSALGFFTHISTVFSIAPLYIYGYINKNKGLIKSLIIIALLLSPIMVYYLINTGVAESPDNPDSFFIYPFAVNGFESTINRGTVAVLHDFFSKPFYYIIGIRIINFVTTTTPAFITMKIISAFVNIPAIYIQKVVVISQVPIIYHWLLSFPGALSSLVYVFAIIGMYRLFYTNRKFFWLLISPLLLSILYWGWIKAGIVNDLLETSVPLFIMVGVSQMKSRKWIYLALAVMLIEGAVFWYFYINSIPAFVQSIPTRIPPVADATQLLNVDSINRVLFS